MLVGVRISAFVSSDDKKPLQKSIIGFLQQGKTDSCGSSQAMQQMYEKDPLSSQSFQTLPLACPSAVQTYQRPEEISEWRKQRGSEGRQTGEEPQQSFFQRAHAKRLQLQAMNASTQEENASVIISPGAYSQKGIESRKEAHKTNNPALDLSENDCVSPVKAHPSTSGCGGTVSESLSCPVCFRRVETTDLNVFNRHIDQCLSDASGKPNPSTFSDPESELEQENDHNECEVVDKRSGAVKASNSKELESNRVDPAEEQPSSGSKSVEATLLISGNNRAATSQQRQSRNIKGPVLICPICQLTQDNNDLIIFNHHVDLCLNQEVLHELGEQTSSLINPPLVTNSKILGESVH